MKTVILVRSDDWTGVYVDDILQTSGHSFRADELVNILESVQPFTVKWVTVNQGWMDDVCAYPRDFNRIPEWARSYD